MFNWCFIGTGRLASHVAKILRSSGRHNIVSCYTRNYEKCEKFAQEVGATPYESSEEAIKDERVDAVYIVTTHNVHYKYAKEALLLHKPVLVEKPFTVFLKDTEDLIKLAKENNTYIAEAMWTWFASPARKVKEWIDENKIGNIQKIDFVWNMVSYPISSPRLYDPKRAGGALLDITIYPITYCYRLFGYPLKIEAKGIVKNGIDMKDDIIFYYPNNIKAHIEASISSLIEQEKMTIIGDKGSIKIPLFHANNEVSYKSKDGNQKFKGKNGQYLNKMISYIDEFDAVMNDVNMGKLENDLVPLSSTLDVMKILEEIRHQIDLNYNEIED